MINPYRAVKGKIKSYVINKGLEEAKSKIDTAEEREEITKRVVSGLHLPGLPKQYAWLLSLLTAAIDSSLEVLSTSDTSLILSDWHTYVRFVAVALVSKFFLWLRQNSANGTAVLEQKVITKINTELTKE